MSEDVSDRSEMLRSTIITVIFSAIFLILGLLFWIWSSPDIIDTSPVGVIFNFNPSLIVVIEALIMLGVFIFLSVTIINLRLFFSEVRAGWLELISIFILVVAMAWAMFGVAVGGASAIFSLGFIVYLYLLQE